MLQYFKERIMRQKLKKIIPSYINYSLIPPFILLTVAIIFRTIYYSNIEVGFDQIQIIEHAKQISKSNYTLVGPRTGPADMFTGPLIYYIAAPFLALFGQTNTILLVPAFIALTTGASIYFLTKRYFSIKLAKINTLIWAFSPLLVNLDRNLWNPILTLMSSFIIFSQLYTKKRDKFTPFLLFIGSFLTYQAHFSGIILLIVAIALIIVLRYNLKLIFPLLLGLMISLVPTILFDIRNQYLNTKGLVKLASGSTESNLTVLFQDVIQNVYILLETLGKIFLFGNNTTTIVTFGFMILITSILVLKLKNIKLPLLWLLSIPILYSFYDGTKPEYYFLISIPPLLFLSSEILNKLQLKILYMVLIFFIINSAIYNFNAFKKPAGFSLKSINEINEYFSKNLVKDIAYDLPYGSEFKVKFFIGDLKTTQTGSIYHIAINTNQLPSNTIVFGDLAVWEDLRSDSANTVSTQTYFITTSPNYSLYKNEYTRDIDYYYDNYILLNKEKVVAQIDISKLETEIPDWRNECQNIKMNQYDTWVINASNQYIKRTIHHCLRLTEKEYTTINLDKLNLEIF